MCFTKKTQKMHKSYKIYYLTYVQFEHYSTMFTIITVLDLKTILKQQHIKTAAENVHTLYLEKAVRKQYNRI